MVAIFVVEDYHGVRMRLQVMLYGEPGMKLVGTASSAEEA
jgi:chemotaxis response regulator CheB